MDQFLAPICTINKTHFSPEDDYGLSASCPLTTKTHSSIVAKLAPETICRILQHVIALESEGFDDATSLPLVREGHHFTSNAYHLGRVCRQWRAIAVSTPSLWTHIKAFVDPPHTVESLASSALQTRLQLSFPLPISVSLYRKVKMPCTLDPSMQEQVSVKALLNTLEDHFERIETLVIETHVASSLPNALDLLGGGSEIPRPVVSRLRRLALRCDADDSILQPLPGSLPPQPLIRALPLHSALTTLYVDGRNLLEMLKSSKSGWSGRVGSETVFSCMPMLANIGVNNLSRCVDGFSEELIHYFFIVILPSFQHLATLTLETIDFEQPQYPDLSSYDDLEVTLGTVPAPLVALSLPRLVFKYTARGSIGFVLRCIRRPHTIILDGCFLSSPTPPPSSLPELLLSCSKLVLANIPSDFDRSLPGLISQWDGEYLELIRCPCIGDDFWCHLVTLLSSVTGKSRPGSEEGGHFGKIPEQTSTQERVRENRLLRHLRSLKAVDCPNVHPDALVVFLIGLRRGRSTPGEHALEELVVAGEQSVKLEMPVQRRWLRNLVSRTMEWS